MVQYITHAFAVCKRGGREGRSYDMYDREATRRMYARVAVVHPSGDTYLSARAFRRLAELANRPIRDIIRGLPPVEWNFSN